MYIELEDAVTSVILKNSDIFSVLTNKSKTSKDDMNNTKKCGLFRRLKYIIKHFYVKSTIISKAAPH